MKKYNFIFKKVNILIVVVIAFIASCIIGCQEENFVDNNSELPFLSIRSDFDLSNLSADEWRTIGLAFQRIDLILENGLYRIKQTSGSQVNISEELFAFLKTTRDHSNQLITNGKIKPSIPRLKQGSESSTNSSTDCVAYSIAAALAKYGKSVSVATISSYLQSQYGTDGVPLSAMPAIMQHYFYGSATALGDNYLPPTGSAGIVVLNNGTSGHAVNLFGSSDGYAVYSDYQNPTPSGNPSSGFVSVSSVLYTFIATGAR